MDYYYLQFLAWMTSLTDGDLGVAMVYGIISAGVVTGSCVWFVRARSHDRATQMRANPFRYVRLRLER